MFRTSRFRADCSASMAEATARAAAYHEHSSVRYVVYVYSVYPTGKHARTAFAAPSASNVTFSAAIISATCDSKYVHKPPPVNATHMIYSGEVWILNAERIPHRPSSLRVAQGEPHVRCFACTTPPAVNTKMLVTTDGPWVPRISCPALWHHTVRPAEPSRSAGLLRTPLSADLAPPLTPPDRIPV